MSQIMWKKPGSGNGWKSPSTDYNDQLARMRRMPSVLPNVPHYPNVYNAFNKKEATTNSQEEEEEEQLRPKNHHGRHKNQNSARFQDQVQVIEYEEEQSEGVDAKADGFIKQKRKGFELCKWTTASKVR